MWRPFFIPLPPRSFPNSVSKMHPLRIPWLRLTNADTSDAGRKVAAGASMKVASPAPSVGYAAASQRGRQQASARASPVRGRRGAAAAAAVIAADTMSVGDEDAEGEEDIEEGADEGDQEDQTIYCFCQQKSYGEVRLRPSHSRSRIAVNGAPTWGRALVRLRAARALRAGVRTRRAPDGNGADVGALPNPRSRALLTSVDR